LLEHSFIHIRGVGELRELAIWRSGIKTWSDFLEKRSFKYPWLSRLLPQVEESLERLNDRDAFFFHSNLPSTQRWRLYDAFKTNCGFLDIETTGLDPRTHTITVAGLLDRRGLKTFIRGKNLDELIPEVKRHPLVVTYGGSCFDLPFIREQFNVARPCDAHIDLRYVLARLGYRGGLKKIEHKFGLQRIGPIANLDGSVAPLLWRQYEEGSYRALEALIRYNAEDVTNLQVLMEKAYALSLKKIPIHVASSGAPTTRFNLPRYDPNFLSDLLGRDVL
jgi:hypothetical protein